MAVILMPHPKGPKLGVKKRFRSYVDLANWAEDNLPYGLYFARNHNASNLAAIREITHEHGRFHVEGRGCI